MTDQVLPDVVGLPPAKWPGQTLVLGSLPTLTVLGPHLSLNPVEGSPVNAARLATAVLLLPALMSLTRSKSVLGPSGRSYVGLSLCLIVWAALGVTWAPNTKGALEEVATTGAAVLGGLVLLAFASRLGTAPRILMLGWTLAFTVIGGIATFERLTGTHLVVNSVILADPTAIASLFGNPNDLAGFLLVSYPFLVIGSIAAHSPMTRTGFRFLLVACVVIAFWTESRTGILGVGILMVVTVWWLARRQWSRALPLVFALALLLFGGLLLAGISTALGDVISTAFAPVQGNSLQLASEYQRWNLISLGIGYGIDSALLGQGPASYEFLAARDAGITRLDGVTNAHNVFIEIFAQFGLVVILPFLTLVSRNLRVAFTRPTSGAAVAEDDLLRLQVLLGTAAIIMAGSVSSSTLDAPWWWAAIAAVSAQAAVVSTRCRTIPACPGPDLVGHRLRSAG